MRSLWWIAVVMAAALPRSSAADVAASEIDRLVAALGDPDYAVREAAAAGLEALGPRSADALLTAAETSDDVEVALRARWLADSIPPTSPADPPEVLAVLRGYTQAEFASRLRAMRRLLRLDGNAGIEPLARLVRLDRSPDAARAAAALLIREWQPGDQLWEPLRPLIAAGVQESGRPAARFLRAVLEASGGDDEAAARAAAAAAAALELLERTVAGPGGTASEAADTSDLWIFRRCLVDMHLAAGRRQVAIDLMRRMFAAGWQGDGSDADGTDHTAANLIWAVEHDLPEAVDLLEARWPGLAIDRPATAYAAAVALVARGDEQRAERLAAAAFAAATDFTARLRAGLLLARWGATEWAIREYRAIVDDAETPGGEFALTGILFSELLHDLGRDDEAAEILRRVVGGRGEGAAEAEETLRRLERDPAGVRSRASFFAACAAASRGDAAGRRRLVEEALGHHGRDVDALIAFYEITADSPRERAEARARVERALERIDDEIQALPDDANGYNEYAWLVANTTGDVQKAIRYSKKSLDMSFDSSSYLDTLAHCRFAAGDRAAAIRTQTVALRMEPHNRTIRRNLDRFRSRADAEAVP